MKFFLFIVFLIQLYGSAAQSSLKPGNYRASVIREDGKEVVFNLEIKSKGKTTGVFVLNAGERIEITDFRINGDSVFFVMPVFESEFKMQKQTDGSLKGIWFKGTSSATQRWPFIAIPGKPRFELLQGPAKNNIAGKWPVTITRANGTKRFALAEFIQKGNKVTGTFLTPSGDYRYLEGVVTGNMLFLSTFDGAHAYTFSAKIVNRETMKDGFFGSGIAGVETWEAVKDKNAQLPKTDAPELKEGFTSLNFSFRDIDGNIVSVTDERYKNKVVIIQAMGSWCPNCMDETKFLSEFYSKNRTRGVEVVALAYEYSTDFERSQKSLRKFQKLFNVQYPMLITGAAVSDTMKTQKTLPQLTEIKVFPTTIFLNKKGEVHLIHPGYYGTGAGKFHDQYKKDFYKTVDELLKD